MKEMHFNKFDKAKECYVMKQYGDCITICNNLLNENELNLEIAITLLHLKGEALLQMQMYNDALSVYNELLGKASDAIAYSNRGWIFFEKEMWNEAYTDYRKSMQLDPANALVTAFVAECLIKLAKLDEAISVLTEGIKMTPSYGRFFSLLGVALSEKEEWLKAYKAFDRASALDAQDVFSKQALIRIEKLIQ